jgi:hypothetical protein
MWSRSRCCPRRSRPSSRWEDDDDDDDDDGDGKEEEEALDGGGEVMMMMVMMMTMMMMMVVMMMMMVVMMMMIVVFRCQMANPVQAYVAKWLLDSCPLGGRVIKVRSILSVSANRALQVTWCCVQRHRANSG